MRRRHLDCEVSIVCTDSIVKTDSFVPSAWIQVALTALSLMSVCSAKPDPNHWSFQKRELREVPEVGEENPIDAFLLKRLKQEGLEFAGPEEPATLLRRVSLDLTGLPPSPLELKEFTDSWKRDEPGAYHDLVDRLLSSPRYGERWGQHWLDAVRYADTHGFEVNTPRSNAWPYRDWVIESFNKDLAYDRFIFEQLAGDAVGQDAATGFLVTAAALLPGQVGKDDESIKRARQDELNEIVINSASSFMGLTVHCARCHDHKFDAISQKDYFRLQAIFGGVHYGERPNRRMVDEREKRVRELEEKIIQSETALRRSGIRLPVNARFNLEEFPSIKARYVRFTILKTNGLEPCLDELEVWSKEGRENVALASKGVKATSSGEYQDPSKHRLEYINDGKYGNSRSWIASEVEDGWIMLDLGKPIKIDRITWGRDREEKLTDRLAVEYRIEVATDPDEWTEVAGSKNRPKTLDGKVLELVREYEVFLAERKKLEGQVMVFAGRFAKPPKTHLLGRGDAMQPLEEVAPGIPGVFGELELSSASSDVERRTALANWLTSLDHPLTARVIVNRVWHGHFGKGLVETPSDFGAMGGRPSHPELLDWLAQRFVDEGWSVKKLHRLIVNSKAYRQSGKPRPEGLGIDAGNRLLWRFRPRRLEAEAIRDSILQISGILDLTMGGPGFSLFKPNANYVRVYEPKEKFGPAEWRRMIYSHRVRMEQDGIFGAFDRPDAGLICSRRTESTTPLQALNLFNSGFVSEQSKLFAKRLRLEGGEKTGDQIKLAFQFCFGRLPAEDELEEGRVFVNEQGLSQFCRVLFNTNEFLFLP